MGAQNLDHLIRLIDETLPQAGLIAAEDKVKWLERTLRIDPERVEWHIRRAGGIGGSEMGDLVAAYEHDRGRNTPERIVKGKLLQLPPDRQDEHMKRGTELEEHARAAFERELDARGLAWARRDDIRREVESGQNPLNSWMRSSLDGVYEIEGQVYIVDFKCPMPDVAEEYEAASDRYQKACADIAASHARRAGSLEAFGAPADDLRANDAERDASLAAALRRLHAALGGYAPQLHHYRLDAEAKGVRIDGMALAVYRYKDNGCAVIEVDHDPGLDARILDAGDLYWNRFVLTGAVPEADVPAVAVPEDGYPDEVRTAGEAFVFHKVVELSSKKKAEAARRTVEAWAKGEGLLGEAVLSVADFMQVKAERVLDCEAAVERLRDLGWDEADLARLRGPSKYDPKRITASYEAMLGAVRAAVAAAGRGEPLAAPLAALADLAEDAPVKEKGDWDPALVEQALVSCNESAEFFTVEKLSSALPRTKNAALDERKEQIEREVAGLAWRFAQPAAVEMPDKDVEEPTPCALP